MAEEAVDIEVACEQRPDPARPVLELALVVGRLPQPEVAEPGALLELVDPGDAALGEDPVPGVFPARMPKLEGVGELWIQRVEEQLQEAVVARAVEGDPDRAEAVTEEAGVLAERGEELEPPGEGHAAVHLEREAEACRSRLRPPLEGRFRRQLVEGRVDLDCGKLIRVVRQEVDLLGARRVEAALPGGVREARGSDVRPR